MRPWALLLLLAAPAIAADTSTVPTKRPPDPELAQALWAQSCSACHGAAGKGDGPLAAALGGIKTLEGRLTSETMDEMVGTVRNGKGKMPAFSETIDAGDTRRILDWMRDVTEGKADPKPPKPAPKPKAEVKADEE